MFQFILILFGFVLRFGDAAYISGNYNAFSNVNVLYKLHKTPMIWLDAVKKCNSECATLAMPKNQAEADVLKSMFHEFKCPTAALGKMDRLLLGFHNYFSEGQFVTLVESEFIEKFNHTWSYGKPSGNTKSNCGSMQHDAKISDFSCSAKAHFVCQKTNLHIENKISSQHNNHQYVDSAYVLEPFSKKSFKIHLTPMVWNQARIVCMSEGSQLAMIESKEEQDFLTKILNEPQNRVTNVAHPGYALLGFHALFKRGDFFTLKGQPVSTLNYFKWNPGEPNHGQPDEDCGSMRPSGLMDDFPCSYPSPFFCEREPDSNKNSQPIENFYHTWAYGQPSSASNENCVSMRRDGKIDDTLCSNKALFVCQIDNDFNEQNQLVEEIYDPGYLLEPFSMKRFKIHLAPLVWNQARIVCMSEGSQLALVESKEEQDFLVKILNEPQNRVTNVAHPGYALLGYHALFKQGNFFTLKGQPVSTLNYFKWNPGEPNHGQPDEDCGSMRPSGLMDDFPCSYPSPFFCERPPKVSDNSQDSYVYYFSANKKYKFHHQPMKWLDAIAQCHSECAKLAMPKNKYEMEILKNIFQSFSHNTTMTVGQKNNLLLGFHDHFSEGQFVTELGKSLYDLHNVWAYGQPAGGGNENCGSMRHDGKIDDISCSMEAFFICEIDYDLNEEPLDEQMHSDPGYVLEPFSKKSFKIHLTPMAWNQARIVCMSEGSQLAMIESKEEQDFLTKILNEPQNRVTNVTYPGYALLGYHALFQRGNFFTLKGKPITSNDYFIWAPGEPNHGQADEDCGSMRPSGLMDDFPCSTASPFFCERPLSNQISKNNPDIDVRFGAK
ncbi:macrophage mannose receptor 1-like isoform X2 [Arctopsyche grandis]|uniref:macrophage mannose receptor 1-like isoform X2 n=1 Tax=Arctopsyche grandis TaxID=121162 RepID=UPI00406D7B46